MSKHSSTEQTQYANPIPDRAAILELLKKQSQALSQKSIAQQLELTSDEQLEALRRRLIAMSRDGQVHSDRNQHYWPVLENEYLKGTVIGHREGFGFLRCEGHSKDFVLHSSQMSKVFDGDLVLALPNGFNQRGREEARIIKVLQANTRQLVGRIEQRDGNYYLLANNQKITQRIEIPEAQLQGAQDGQYVSAELVQYPHKRNNAQAHVSEILGEPMAPRMEITLALHNHEIPHKWPEQALQQAELLGDEVSEQDKLNRIDLRALPFVTIDGEDAQDFDDAVYCQADERGGWRLWVAIADVSHYIKTGTALDQEAQKRGTSVYFPGHVVPMLPEAISNGLCSLKPKLDRLALVCEMQITPAGELLAYQFYEAVIHSHARLSYTEVGNLLANSQSSRQQDNPNSELLSDIQQLHALYRVLAEARQRRGAIDFSTQENRFIFNSEAKIEQIVPVQRNDAHKLIEECMLCANLATAAFLSQLSIPSLYRVHQGPKAKKLKALRSFLAERGLNLAGGEQPSPADYNQLLSQTAARVDAAVIQTMLLRSMNQAVYSPENEGHFGLAFAAYAHFTSPIRRYPDLLVHRAIRAVIHSKETGGIFKRIIKKLGGKGFDPVKRVTPLRPQPFKQNYPYQISEILALAEHCSMCARRADEASWEVDAWLKCHYMQAKLGEQFQATISGVNSFGLFVELADIPVEGSIHISALADDFYHFDATKQRLLGERKAKAYSIGQPISVTLARIDLDQRKIEFVLSKSAKQGQTMKTRSVA